MTPEPHVPHLERRLATLLQVGTAVSSTIIGLGIALNLLGASVYVNLPWLDTRPDLVTVGIASFILLPILRVVVMLIAYLRARDVLLGAISALVLAIIAAGLIAGTAMSASPSPAPNTAPERSPLEWHSTRTHR